MKSFEVERSTEEEPITIQTFLKFMERVKKHDWDEEKDIAIIQATCQNTAKGFGEKWILSTGIQ
jgi:hypothetical protein